MNRDLFAAEARYPFAQEQAQQRHDSCLSHRGVVDLFLGPQVGPCSDERLLSLWCVLLSSAAGPATAAQRPSLLIEVLGSTSQVATYPPPTNLGLLLMCLHVSFLLVPMAAGKTTFHRAEG
jgi:hypothetical protein